MRSQYTGPATVFRHDKNGRTFYSVAVSRKNSEGESIFGYKLVQFKRGVDVADRTKIDIQNAWESFYLNQDGEAVFYVFIADFTLQQGSATGYGQPQQAPQYQQPQTYAQPQGYAPQYQQPVQYPQNVVQQQFGQAPQYAPQPPQPQQPNPADTFEAIDEDVPF